MSIVKSLKSYFLNKDNFLFDIRGEEYTAALKFLESSNEILDVGCGTGTFLEFMKSKQGKIVRGIDLNEENVSYALDKGLEVSLGCALDMPFADNTFDAVFSSHLMQVFSPEDANTFFQECLRVVKKDGLIVISTLNWFPNFFRHPENHRPYPPEAILRYTYEQENSTSPMFKKINPLSKVGIWHRRPALLELHPGSNDFLNKIYVVFNHLQLKLGFRKFWKFDSYIICLKVGK
tara:strand:+ start:5124 stop:5825 length:702 start_codon:yes stop_codon:yes gene_type:complete